MLRIKYLYEPFNVTHNWRKNDKKRMRRNLLLNFSLDFNFKSKMIKRNRDYVSRGLEKLIKSLRT